jgi:DNA-binding CsgD family transcriptional regulator/tetratricopeptide (TPR) repeat protein
MDMLATSSRRPLLFLLFVIWQTNYILLAQSAGIPVHDWVQKLSARNAPPFSGVSEILPAVVNDDSAHAVQIFRELENNGDASNKYFTCRLNVVMATYFRNRGASSKFVDNIMTKAINAAYESDNDSLVSAVSWHYGMMNYWGGEIQLASMYCLNAAEIDEKIGRKISPGSYNLLAEVLYATRDNEKSIYYTKKAIAAQNDTSFIARDSNMKRLNTIALCWKRMGNYDSAFFYFNLALRKATELGENIWRSIILGNEGQIYYAQQKYDLAKPLLESDYRFSKGYGELGSASNSLQWVARINLLQGKKDSALMQVREALQLVQQDRNPNYLQNIYYATADVYRALGKNDSSYKYSQLYNNLHDSIERTVADGRVEMAQIRVANLQNAFTIKNLNKEKQAERLKRNFVIAAILFISIIALFYVNRLRLKFRHKEQMAAEQQKTANAEIAAAREQLQLFTQNLVEKTNLIEQLQEQLHNRSFTLEQQELLSNISNVTILTDSDWEKFKALFDKIYPGFFLKLKENVTDITVAEQRMAALTRLHLSINQIASILGISPNSVYKTKQRLRQRLNVDSEMNIEEILNKI